MIQNCQESVLILCEWEARLKLRLNELGRKLSSFWVSWVSSHWDIACGNAKVPEPGKILVIELMAVRHQSMYGFTQIPEIFESMGRGILNLHETKFHPDDRKVSNKRRRSPIDLYVQCPSQNFKLHRDSIKSPCRDAYGYRERNAGTRYAALFGSVKQWSSKH